MADRYIDQDETKIYGAHAARKIRKNVVGLVPELDKALAYLAGEIDDTTAAVAEAVAAARAADTDLRKHVKSKTSALSQSFDLLRRFSKHLDAHPAGSIDRKAFFVADGTVGGIGRSVSRVVLALGHIATALKGKHKDDVKDAAAWAKECSGAASRLAPIVEHADDAKTDRSEATPEVENARRAWLTTYAAAKCVVEGVLRLTGKLDQMPRIFHDLAVPANAKVTEAPADDEEPGTEPSETPPK